MKFLETTVGNVSTVTTPWGPFKMDADKLYLLEEYQPELVQGRVRFRKGKGADTRYYTATHVLLGLPSGSRRRVFHKDRDPRNCCLSNLMTVEARQKEDKAAPVNRAFRRSLIYRGVNYIDSRAGVPTTEDDTPWHAFATAGNGKKISIGYFHTEDAAGKALTAFHTAPLRRLVNQPAQETKEA